MKIDLGIEDKVCGAPCDVKSPVESESKVRYPTVWIRSSKKIPLPDGEFTFTARAKKVASEERERDGQDSSYSCEIELYDMTPSKTKSDDGLVSVGDAIKNAVSKTRKEKGYA